jgi:hypothetical protein
MSAIDKKKTAANDLKWMNEDVIATEPTAPVAPVSPKGN